MTCAARELPLWTSAWGPGAAFMPMARKSQPRRCHTTTTTPHNHASAAAKCTSPPGCDTRPLVHVMPCPHASRRVRVHEACLSGDPPQRLPHLSWACASMAPRHFGALWSPPLQRSDPERVLPRLTHSRLTSSALDGLLAALPCESPRWVLGTGRAGRPAIGLRRSQQHHSVDQ